MIYFIPDDVIINIDGTKQKREPTTENVIQDKSLQENL